MDEDLLEKTKDSVVPVLVIDSPETESLFNQTVVVTGSVTDDGAVLPELHYSVKNELGEIKAEGVVELTAETVDSGVKGTFSFSFSTSSMDTDVLLEMTAVDWNDNEAEVVSVKLLYPGSSIPTFSVQPGNDSIALSWDALPEAASYTVYYSPKGEEFLENTAHSFTLTADEVGESAEISMTSEEYDIANGWMTKVRVKAESETGSWLSPLLTAIPVSCFTLIPKSNCYTDKIALSWKPFHTPAGERVNYTVWRSSSYDGVYSRISSDSLDEAFYEDTGVPEGQTVYYKIGYTVGEGVEEASSSEPLAAETSVLDPDASADADVNLLLTDDTELINHVEFASDGSRAFAIDSIYVSSTTSYVSYLMETSLSGSGANGTVMEISVPEVSGNRMTIHGLKATPERTYVALSAKEDGVTTRQIRSYDISVPGSMTYNPSENISFSSICRGLNYGTPGGTETLFYFDSAGLRSVDISDPASPGTPVTHSALSGIVGPTYVQDVAYAGGYLYILHYVSASTDWNLTAYDVTAHTQTTYTLHHRVIGSEVYGAFSLEADASSGNLVVAASGYHYQYIYPADKGFLWYFDIGTDPADPSLERYEEMGIRIDDVEVLGARAFCSTYNGLVLVVDLNSTALIARSEIKARGYGPDLDVADGSARVIVASGSSGVSYTVIEDSQSPSYGDIVSLGYGGIARNNVCFADGYLYAPTGQTTMKSYTQRSDGSLTLFSERAMDTRSVLVRGNYLFTGYKTLTIARMSAKGDVASMEVLAELNVMGDITGLAIRGDYLYVSEGNFGVEIFNISDPSRPESIGWANSFGEAREIFIARDRLIMADTSLGLRCFDVSVPESPELLGDFRDTDSDAGTDGLSVAGDYIYWATSTGLFVLRGEDASTWRNASSVSGDPGSALDWVDTEMNCLNAQGDALYAAVKASQFYFGAFDITLPAKPDLFYMNYDTYIKNSPVMVVSGSHFFSHQEHDMRPFYLPR